LEEELGYLRGRTPDEFHRIDASIAWQYSTAPQQCQKQLNTTGAFLSSTRQGARHLNWHELPWSWEQPSQTMGMQPYSIQW